MQIAARSSALAYSPTEWIENLFGAVISNPEKLTETAAQEIVNIMTKKGWRRAVGQWAVVCVYRKPYPG